MPSNENIEGRLNRINNELAAINSAAYCCSADNDTTEPLCDLVEQVQALAAVVTDLFNRPPSKDEE